MSKVNRSPGKLVSCGPNLLLKKKASVQRYLVDLAIETFIYLLVTKKAYASAAKSYCLFVRIALRKWFRFVGWFTLNNWPTIRFANLSLLFYVRACPEKIIEFKEKMEAKKKKKKPKQKQSKSTERETSSPTKASSLIELSLQLQQIDLNSTSTLAISTMEEAEQEKEQQKSKKHNYLRLIDSPAKENSSTGWSTIRRFGVGPSSYSFYPETEVIDLISPCPEARSRNVSRRYQEQKSHEQKCLDHKLENVIELSDSETDDDGGDDDDDDDGEHCRKARELRMFLENIRKDVIL